MSDRKLPETLRVLIDARRRIEDRANWFGLDNRRDPSGTQVCLMIAVDKAYCAAASRFAGAPCSSPAAEALRLAIGGPLCDPVRFNDTHTHGDVVALLDKAIAAQHTEVPNV